MQSMEGHQRRQTTISNNDHNTTTNNDNDDDDDDDDDDDKYASVCPASRVVKSVMDAKFGLWDSPSVF